MSLIGIFSLTTLSLAFPNITRPKWDDECRDYDKAFILAMDLVRAELTEVIQVIGGSDWRARLALRAKISTRHDDHQSGR